VTMLAARASGAARVYMTDLVPVRVAKAKQMGANEVMNASDGNVAEWINDLTHGRGVDVAFEATGEQQGVTDAFVTTRRGGKALLIGIPTTDELAMPMHECRRKELLVQHVRRSNGEVHAAMNMVASGLIDVKPLATHRFSLDQVAEAFGLVSRYGDGVIRAVVLPNGEIDGKRA
jgi:L-iditol 2-dehydrogenase